jgi:hypothetical protein
MTSPATEDWFAAAIAQINTDLNGALGDLTEPEVEAAKLAMLAAMRTTIAANPSGFKSMLTKLAPHPASIVDAGTRAKAPA